MLEWRKAIKGLTGLMFTVLGVSILNYGTKLETSVSKSIHLNSVDNSSH